jgi:hypothetical protein
MEKIIRDYGRHMVYGITVTPIRENTKKLVGIDTDGKEIIWDVVDDVEIYADIDSANTLKNATQFVILEPAHCKVVTGEDEAGLRDPGSERLVCE